MTKNYKSVVVPVEVYEIIRRAAYRRHVPISHILRDLAATLTTSKKKSRV